MRVLVTGHKGYIGTVMVPMLLDSGTRLSGWIPTFSSLAPLPPEEWMPMFLRCARTCATQRPTISGIRRRDPSGGIVQRSARRSEPGDLTFDINYRASVRLARLAKEVGVYRFLFSSSCSNYGAAGEELTEESTLQPRHALRESKVLVERDVSMLADDDFCPTFMRPATAFGVSPRIRFDLVLNNLTAWAVTTGRIYMKSDGSPWRPIVHIADICRAFIAALEAPRTASSTRRSTSVAPSTIIASATSPRLSRMWCRIAGSRRRLTPGPDKRSYRVNFSKIERVLPGFQAKVGRRRGAEQLLAAYRQSGLTLEEFEGPRYQRISHIQRLIAARRSDF